MGAVEPCEISAMSIEECRRLDAPLRDDLETLDHEVRSLVARIRREARDAGTDDAVFLKASTTVLLSIAAGLFACAAEERNTLFDARAFVIGADRVAKWAFRRRVRRAIVRQA